MAKNNSSKSSNKSVNTKSQKSSTKGTTKETTKSFNGKMRSTKEVETRVEIILWIVLALCVLLFISNLGLGGTIGGAISGFFFGVFGLIAYIFPVAVVLMLLFYFANRGRGIMVVKLIAGIILFLQVPIILELIRSGNNPPGAVSSFYYGQESKNGGGFIGGLLSKLMIEGFGLIGAYVISLLLLIISFILITERTLLRGRSSRQRPRRPERVETEDPAIARSNRLDRIKEDKRRQQEALSNKEGRRRDRKISGVTYDLSVAAADAGYDSDELSEVKLSPEDDIEVAEVNRLKLKSKDKSSRTKLKSSASAESVEAKQARIVHDALHGVEPDMDSAPYAQPAPVAKPAARATTSTKSSPKVVVAESKVSPAAKPKAASSGAYIFPPITLLKKNKSTGGANTKAALEATADKLEQTLANFGIKVVVTDVTCGPSVTRFELLPEKGIRVNRITNLADDIKLNLAVTDIRIEAPIPGKAAVGIEVPNASKVMVTLEELIASKEFDSSESKVTFCAGRDIAGNVITTNISKMPHLLIAGTTGSGKSVCINTIIMSILYKATPEDVKMIMIDPKVVELSIYNGIPHLLVPVVTDPKKAAGALHWAVQEMDDRYQRFANAGVRDIKSYNKKLIANDYQMPINSRGELGTFEKMPEMVVIVDELADLMMVAAKEVEESICRLAQKARAAGIYLILATQRPSVDVCTGLIKANMPSRIAFAVKSGTDSRTIIDMYGAEKLLGNGDMLYYPQGLTQPLRVQGAFVSDDEVSAVVDYIQENNAAARYDDNVTKVMESAQESGGAVPIGGATVVDSSLDSLFAEAGRLACDKEKISIGMLQRAFRIGFNRAARLMEQLEEAGVVGPDVGTKPREVTMSLGQFESYLGGTAEEYPVDDTLD